MQCISIHISVMETTLTKQALKLNFRFEVPHTEHVYFAVIKTLIGFFFFFLIHSLLINQ